MWIQELKTWKSMKTTEERKGASATRLVRDEAPAPVSSAGDTNKHLSRPAATESVRAGHPSAAGPAELIVFSL